MNPPKPIDQQADDAMQRINQTINRSAGQHLRAVRRIRAGQPPSEGTTSAQQILRRVPLQRMDTQQLPDNRTVVHHGEPTPEEIDEAAETESGMQMLAYCLIALVATAGAIGLGVLFSSL
jgi:hypothetical protein